MMGPSILVAPVFAGQSERKIVLPKGDWFDFYTGEYAGNGETITIQTKLEEIPLFVKDGAIIPMLTSIKKDETEKSLEIRHYGKKENTFSLYNDDGVSYDYEKGEFSITELKVEKTKDGELSGSSKPLNSEEFNYDDFIWRWMTK
jgi:alpha-D-xyloside xylohydrolase